MPITSGGRSTLRFALSLILALLLHGTALYYLRFPSSPAVAGRKAALEVVLLAAEAPSSAGFRDSGRGVSITGMVAPPPSRAEPPPVPGEGNQLAPTPVRESQPAISAAQLLESARRIIREEAKNTEQGAVMGNQHPADTVEAKLAKALSAPSAGERRLNDGLVKITTDLGTAYCLKAPPDRMRDGLVEQISIPMTCP